MRMPPIQVCDALRARRRRGRGRARRAGSLTLVARAVRGSRKCQDIISFPLSLLSLLLATEESKMLACVKKSVDGTPRIF